MSTQKWDGKLENGMKDDGFVGQNWMKWENGIANLMELKILMDQIGLN